MKRRAFILGAAALPLAPPLPAEAPAAPVSSGLTLDRLLAAKSILDASEVSGPHYVWFPATGVTRLP